MPFDLEKLRQLKLYHTSYGTTISDPQLATELLDLAQRAQKYEAALREIAEMPWEGPNPARHCAREALKS